MMGFLHAIASWISVPAHLLSAQPRSDGSTAFRIGSLLSGVMRQCGVLSALLAWWLGGCGVATAQSPIVLGQTVTQTTAGGYHTCALTTAGGVRCWGNNGNGQSNVPAALVGGGVAAIAVGMYHTCAVTAVGGALCWGYNYNGQTNVPTALWNVGVAAISAGA